MPLYKRGKSGMWWMDEAVHDRRIRTSLHTTDWKEAQHRRKPHEIVAYCVAGTDEGHHLSCLRCSAEPRCFVPQEKLQSRHQQTSEQIERLSVPRYAAFCNHGIG